MAASDILNQMENQADEIEIGKHGLRKRVLRQGTSWKTPFLGDEVTGKKKSISFLKKRTFFFFLFPVSCFSVHYSVRLKDGSYSDSSREKGTPFTFKLGQCMFGFCIFSV